MMRALLGDDWNTDEMMAPWFLENLHPGDGELIYPGVPQQRAVESWCQIPDLGLNNMVYGHIHAGVSSNRTKNQELNQVPGIVLSEPPA